MNKLVYLACPYTHDNPAVMMERFMAANKAAAELMSAGALVFSPISHTHPIAQYGLPKGFDFWEKYDRAFMGMCHAAVVLMVDGWQQSKGVTAEIEFMKLRNRPVLYMSGDVDGLIRGQTIARILDTLERSEKHERIGEKV